MGKKVLEGLVIWVLVTFMIIVNVSNLYLTRNVDQLSKNLKIFVVLKGELNSSDTQSLVEQITEMYGVVSANFVSKEATFSTLEQDLGTQFNYLDNPFSDQIIVVVKPAIDVKDLATTIESNESVQECDFDAKYLTQMSGVIALSKRLSLLIMLGGNIGLFLCIVWVTHRVYERNYTELQEIGDDNSRLAIIKTAMMWIIGIVVAFGIIILINGYIFKDVSDFFGGKPYTLGAYIKACYLPLMGSVLVALATLFISRSRQ